MGRRARVPPESWEEGGAGLLLLTPPEPDHTLTFHMEGKPDLTIDMKDMLRFIALCRAMKMADEGMADEGMAEKDDHKRSRADEMAMITFQGPPKKGRAT